MVPPGSALQSDEAGPDLGWLWSLADGVHFIHDLDVLDVAGDGVILLGPSGPTLGEQS
jgi:hypothetical protein